MTDKKDQKKTPKQLLQKTSYTEKEDISKAPPPITPLDPKPSDPVMAMIARDINKPLDPIVPITAIELMERWFIDARTLIMFSFEETLFPSFPTYFRDDVSWLLVQDDKTRENYLSKCIYDRDVTDVFEVLFADHLAKVKKPEIVNLLNPPTPVKTSAVNFFTKENGDYWHIGFEGKETRIKHLTGLQCIGYLLEKPGTTISCRELYEAASGKTPYNAWSEGAAIDEGLYIGGSKQAKSDPMTKAQLLNEYVELDNDLLKINDLPYEDRTPEDEMQKQEIVERMAKIKPYLQDKNFADPNDIKAQSNIGKRLKTAYEAIGKKGMQGMEKHLRAKIKPNGNFGLSYTGDLSWKITLIK